MKVIIYEWKPNPIYNVTMVPDLNRHAVESKAVAREVNSNTLTRWTNAMEEFWAVQQEMRAYRDSPPS